MKIHKQLVFIAVLFCGAGIAIAAPLGFSWLEQRQALASSVVTQSIGTTVAAPLRDDPAIIKGAPRHVSVPSLGIDTNVADGSYNVRTGQWTLSEDSAFYATLTTPANSDSGNTFIYGHDSRKVFGKLLYIKPGAEVTVTTDNGYVFTYIYTSSEAVKPTDVAALEYSGKPRLTLQTCSGIWSETRQMVYFELKSYQKV